MDKNKKILLINLFWTIIYALCTLILVIHHEIWADEAQVWMLVKNLSVPQLFKHLVNEGHPSFFYLLMMPFAKLGLSAFVMQIACWFSMCVSVFLLLQFSPFNRFAKFSIITSAGFLYFFPVIARSYSILPLLVFSLAMLYPKAKEHPYLYAVFLVLCANTHIIMYAFCGILALYFLFDNLKPSVITAKAGISKNAVYERFAPLIIIFLGLLAVFLQLHGTTSSNAVIKIDSSNILSSTVKVVSEFFINAYDNQYPEIKSIMFPDFGMFAILGSVILYISFFVTLFIKKKKLFTLASLGILFQIVIYVIGYNHWIFVTRIFCAHLILLFCFWLLLKSGGLSSKEKTVLNTSIGIFFLLTMLNGLKYSVLELIHPYSGAKETAEYIEKNINKQTSIIVTDNEPYSMAVVYYLDGKRDIHSVFNDKSIRYVVWDDSMFHVLSEQGYSEYAKYMQEHNPGFKVKKLYALVPFFDFEKMGVNNIQNFKMIFESKPSIVKLEGFRIYEYSSPLDKNEP